MDSPNRGSGGEGEDRFRRLIDAGTALLSELDLEAVLRSVVGAARELTGARHAAVGVLDRDRRELERFVHLGIDDETRREIGRLRGGGERPATRAFLDLPITVGGEAYGNLYLTQKEGAEEFDEADEEAAGALARWAGIAVHNARLHQALSEREADLQQGLREARASVDIARTVGDEVEVERVLDLIATRAQELVGASALVVLLRRGDGLVAAARAGRAGARLERLEIGLEEPAQRVRERLGAAAALLVPLQFRDRVVGALLALDREPDGSEFDEEDLHLLQAFAASAATAVATAQSAEVERHQQWVESGERERERWARELHDETLQSLAAIRISLAMALQSRAEDRGERIERAAAETIDRLEGQINELSRLIDDLRPAALERLGLAAALANLAEDSAQRGRFEVETDIDLNGTLTRDEERAVYRLAQEALTNVLRHSAAGHVTMCVRMAGGEVRVAIGDDGTGFDPSVVRAGRGLLGMEEWVALLGGRLVVDSRPARGTEVTATLPVGRG